MMVLAATHRSLADLAHLLGGEIRGGQILAPGPGHGRKDRSLAVRLDRETADGFIFYSFSGDARAACRAHILSCWGLASTYRPAAKTSNPRARTSRSQSRGQSVEASQVIWRSCQTVVGSLGESYLASRRLRVDARLSEVLRFHSALWLDGAPKPALVALLRDIRTDAPCGIHRTWLSETGQKLTRKMLGQAKNAAVKLDADEDVTNALTIGEGVETAMAGRQLDCGPVWAVGSAMAIQTFPVLAGVEALRILAEEDANGANARAIEVVAKRWLSAGRDVFVFQPARGDMNDAVMDG